ncbi:hypothetical protein [Vulcanisaeta sp. JCM 14467]|uniref:hypothetical protein n=1 Tax=Vulcanisaeta sp. JCM 14467 TaxID=1295370 RepID=UPI0006D0BEA2|nr:hypothetical protein [Vulcanisaeta sp. JCM 14467]
MGVGGRDVRSMAMDAIMMALQRLEREYPEVLRDGEVYQEVVGTLEDSLPRVMEFLSSAVRLGLDVELGTYLMEVASKIAEREAIDRVNEHLISIRRRRRFRRLVIGLIAWLGAVGGLWYAFTALPVPGILRVTALLLMVQVLVLWLLS